MSDKHSGIDFSLVLASSVHDMKNSVGMLLASLEALIEDSPPENPSQKHQFSTLQYEASRINSELIQLLTIYRMNCNFVPVRIDEHYVIDILDDQVARNHTLMDMAGIELTINCEDDLNWYFDSDLIGSVIHNVIVNCTRYSKTAISISATMEDNLLCVAIEDDGPGYPQEMLEKPASLMEDAEICKGKTRLGLFFAEQIAAYHKQNNRVGYIKLENNGTLGGGVFKIFIP